MSRERVLRSLDAGLVTLHIVTAPNMPTNVHVEESIDQLISHTKYQLENNIYPEFDPVYRAETKGDFITVPIIGHVKTETRLIYFIYFVCRIWSSS